MTRLSELEVKKGDHVVLKREFMDDGDENYRFVAVDDMEHGRVTIEAQGTGLSIAPSSVVSRHMISSARS